ncbi:MAG: efflux RND transporter permease subunit [Saprospiraceae bacterium]
MTLGGLALSVGILVDESTVSIENIHHHLELDKSKSTANWDACKEIAVPKLLILLSIISVFVPALFMTGIPKIHVYAFIHGSWICHDFLLFTISNIGTCTFKLVYKKRTYHQY